MFAFLRDRFGIPGVIAVAALVFAMAGGAWALATNSGDSAGKATASKAKKGAKGPRGPKGAKGAKGATGPTGPQGAAGPAGKDGLNGSDGLDGEKGAKGSPGTAGLPGNAGATGATGVTGDDGATGATGNTGSEGSPWTAGGTLPSGKTETGVWAIGQVGKIKCATNEEPTPTCTATPEPIKAASQIVSPISFTIPLANAMASTNYHYVPATVSAGTGTGDLQNTGTSTEKKTIKNVLTATGSFTVGSTISGTGIPANATITKVTGTAQEFTEGKGTLEISLLATVTQTAVQLTAGNPAACQGSAAHPQALAGHLCVYAGTENEMGTMSFSQAGAGASPEASTAGALIGMAFWKEGSFARGTWAVTAP